MNVLCFEHVSFRIGGKGLLENVTLSLKEGEFLGILGPNGAGKSTLLALMDLLWRPTDGTFSIFGTEVKTLNAPEILRLRRKIAIVPQNIDYNPSIPLTAREVVEMGRIGRRGVLSHLTQSDRVAVDFTMGILGVSHLASHPYRSLSGGERQKVQLARALAQEPALLFLDEPTSGLDMDWQERLVLLIEELYAKMKLTIVMTTHITGHLPACCRRVILLRDGRILMDGAVEDVLTPEKLKDVYRCPVEVIERSGRRHCFAMGDVK